MPGEDDEARPIAARGVARREHERLGEGLPEDGVVLRSDDPHREDAVEVTARASDQEDRLTAAQLMDAQERP